MHRVLGNEYVGRTQFFKSELEIANKRIVTKSFPAMDPGQKH